MGFRFDSFDDCVARMEADGVDDPAALCAQLYYDDTGRWPAEKEGGMPATRKDTAAVGSLDWVRERTAQAVQPVDGWAWVREVFPDRVI